MSLVMPLSSGVSRVHTITLPLPFRLKAVNLYLLEDCEGHILIDAGVNTPEASDALDEALRDLDVRWESIHTVFITHYHSDHCGLAALVRKRSRAAVYMAREDFNLLRTFERRPDTMVGPEGFYVEHGMPRKMVGMLGAATALLMDAIVPFRPDRFYRHGEVIARQPFRFLPLHTPGHTVGHTCLFEKNSGLLFSGDHVLDPITPNISACPANPLTNPLGSYLRSLSGLVGLKVSRTLPGHGNPIVDLNGRIRSIHVHHEDRTRRVLEALDAGAGDAFTVSLVIFGDDLDLLERWMAFQEILAHLVWLEDEGRVARTMEGTRVCFRAA
ncbi:MBL fold metallo-hydrolase [Desulfoglaeba alkanexedens ALDC]|uniref:MBL fold metallo-hydrolase n=1 Tax=Desulfoglaeba alkanexedens ALDC TaxID=980445 RepID=A0A4V1ERJ8_9BACT|nr:MBL fold metallo-hydrolase [Desulfoglaeba alkanexedens ALDC]